MKTIVALGIVALVLCLFMAIAEDNAVAKMTAEQSCHYLYDDRFISRLPSECLKYFMP